MSSMLFGIAVGCGHVAVPLIWQPGSCCSAFASFSAFLQFMLSGMTVSGSSNSSAAAAQRRAATDMPP
eukprot:3423720-Alexandrium_andersonii.AAC.1